MASLLQTKLYELQREKNILPSYLDNESEIQIALRVAEIYNILINSLTSGEQLYYEVESVVAHIVVYMSKYYNHDLVGTQTLRAIYNNMPNFINIVHLLIERTSEE